MESGEDVLLFNANVLTMEGSCRASAVSFHKGRIARVGDSETLRKEAVAGTTLLDLQGRTVVPGFTDAHAHIWKIGYLLTSTLDLREIASLTELHSALREPDRMLPDGAWLLGRGFNEVAMAENRKPDRFDLDRAVPIRPVALTRMCGHMYSVNSVALKLAGVTSKTPTPTGGVIERDKTGEPNGILHETAMGLMNRVMPQPAHDDYEKMIQTALQHQLSLGITASSDCGVVPDLLEVYRDMDRKGALPSRVTVMPLRRVDGRDNPVPLPEKHVSDKLRIDTVKFLADGGLSGATAAISIPYRHANTKGTLRFETEDLRRLCRESHDQGWRIATHAIGDVAIDLVLSIYEQLNPNPHGLVHRIEHFGLPSPKHLESAARMGIVSVTQAIFIHEFGSNFLQMIPDVLLQRTYPIRSMLDAGLTVALSSDAPVVDNDNPLVGMYAAITRRSRNGRCITPEERITATDALYAYTMGGAIAFGDAAARGSIMPGKWADVAVLSDDPLAAEPATLPNIKVDMTFLAGKQVYSRTR